MTVNARLIKTQTTYNAEDELLHVIAWWENVDVPESLFVDESNQDPEITPAELLSDIGGRIDADWV